MALTNVPTSLQSAKPNEMRCPQCKGRAHAVGSNCCGATLGMQDGEFGRCTYCKEGALVNYVCYSCDIEWTAADLPQKLPS